MASEKTLTASEIEGLVSRLSRQKEPSTKAGEKNKNNGRSLTKIEAEQLVERLAAPKKINSPQAALRKRTTTGLTNDDIDQIFERLSTQKKEPSPPPVYRGEKLGQLDIDRIVERLSSSKAQNGTKEPKKNKMTIPKKSMEELTSRLTNKELAMEKTPESKRTHNKQFGIVSSYVWNGSNYQAILCNEESP